MKELAANMIGDIFYFFIQFFESLKNIILDIGVMYIFEIVLQILEK